MEGVLFWALLLGLIGLVAVVLGTVQGSKNTVLMHRDLLWSKGWTRAHQAYALKGTETPEDSTLSLSPEQGVVWVKMGSSDHKDLRLFVTQVLDTLTEDFVLLTSDGDLTVPDDLDSELVERLVGAPHLKQWWAQNLNAPSAHSKMHHLPIGLDLHTVRPPLKSMNDKRQLFHRMSREKKKPRLFRIWCDAHLTDNDRFGNPRKRMGQALPELQWMDGLKHHVTQEEIWRKYQEYQFVVSLTGNGLDCHRTWEALGLGATVITFSTGLDPLFQNYRVIILPSSGAEWKTLLNDQAWLRAQQAVMELKPIANLSQKYWLTQVKACLT